MSSDNYVTGGNPGEGHLPTPPPDRTPEEIAAWRERMHQKSDARATVRRADEAAAQSQRDAERPKPRPRKPVPPVPPKPSLEVFKKPTPGSGSSAVLAEIREAGATAHLLREFATARGMKVAKAGIPGRGVLRAWIEAGKPRTFEQDRAVEEPAEQPASEPEPTTAPPEPEQRPDDAALAAAEVERTRVLERLERVRRELEAFVEQQPAPPGPLPYPLRPWWHDEIAALADLIALAVRAQRAGMADLPRDLELAAGRLAQSIAPATEEHAS